MPGLRPSLSSLGRSAALGSRPSPLRSLPGPAASFSYRWADRTVRSTLPGLYRISVPLHGGPVPAAANAILTRSLDRLCVESRLPPGTAAAITSVVAIIGRDITTGSGDEQCLTLLLTAGPAATDDVIDGPTMERRVRIAMDHLTGATDRAEESEDTP